MRRIVEAEGADPAGPAPFDANRRLDEALLTPTRIYVKPCLAAIRAGGVRALAHITGGGLVENLPRVIPEGLAPRLQGLTWPVPAVFRWLARAGGVAPGEMLRTFNCGLGMAVIVDPGRAEAVTAVLAESGERVHRIGRIVAGDGAPGLGDLDALEAAWPG